MNTHAVSVVAIPSRPLNDLGLEDAELIGEMSGAILDYIDVHIGRHEPVALVPDTFKGGTLFVYSPIFIVGNKDVNDYYAVRDGMKLKVGSDVTVTVYILVSELT